jgi:23S rRNA (cytidine1920-2'-O)/16S rRNA (cytidine1409-2'-O)-methyltransferase
MQKLLAPEHEMICLIKPQFEAGRQKVEKGGVVRDPKVHEEVIENVSAHAKSLRYSIKGLTQSPIKGPAGNVEYLLHLCHSK